MTLKTANWELWIPVSFHFRGWPLRFISIACGIGLLIDLRMSYDYETQTVTKSRLRTIKLSILLPHLTSIAQAAEAKAYIRRRIWENKLHG